MLFSVLGHASLATWSVAYLAATMATAAIALTFFMPASRWRFTRSLYPRRMADAIFASAADIVFYMQAELDKLLVLALAGERSAGLYAIAMRVIDLTAMPVRSFNQMLVQKIMKERGLGGGPGRLAMVELGIAAISIGGLAAVILALKPFPGLLGRNVAEAAYLFAPMLLVPAFRNLVEYHAELLYARERTGSRIVLLCAIAALKAALVSWVMMRFGRERCLGALAERRLRPGLRAVRRLHLSAAGARGPSVLLRLEQRPDPFDRLADEGLHPDRDLPGLQHLLEGAQIGDAAGIAAPPVDLAELAPVRPVAGRRRARARVQRNSRRSCIRRSGAPGRSR